MKKNNKIKKSVSVLAFLFVCAVSVILSSCSDELDFQQSYPFKVETMPVPKYIVRGQTVEIRCELKAEGKFDGTIYTIRYFQHDGKGSLRMENGTVFQPNDRYLLENEKFRLYFWSYWIWSDGLPNRSALQGPPLQSDKWHRFYRIKYFTNGRLRIDSFQPSSLLVVNDAIMGGFCK